MMQIYTHLTTKEIKPTGWLRRQLRIQADGLSGNLHKIWPDVRDSRWIGGDREGWERVPYWLDGFIPLAHLLEDQELIDTANRYIDAILAAQQPDGWICPCAENERASYDMWALYLICKVLIVHYDCTGDERIEDAVYRALSNLHSHILKNTLFNWAAARWFECLIPLYWLYQRRPEDWMIELAHLLHAQGLDYSSLLTHLPYHPNRRFYWSQHTHVVNLAMAIKSDALYAKLTGEDPSAFAKFMLEKLRRENSTVVGLFTGDECVSGDSANQGTELCAIVEAMYSYEQLIAITGDNSFADLLERLAYNALPAAISPDMWTHQYDQMTNQIGCQYLPEQDIHFNSNDGESHLFGLEPHFGCCTANFNQGWPKFALSAVMRAEDGLAITAIAPIMANVMIDGVPVSLRIETDYPFRDTARLIIKAEKPIEFALRIRIPGWAGEALLDGEVVSPGYAVVRRVWQGESTLSLSLNPQTEFISRPGGLMAVARGPLIYSVPVKARWVAHEFTRRDVERKIPYCDYEVFAEEPWAYGFADCDTELCEKPIGQTPFDPDNPPLQLQANLAPVDWERRNGICNALPVSAKATGDVRKATLIPYGCTTLRMTEMPLIR